MRPYYDSGGITLYHGDCRDVLPTLGRVDLVLTDPPYGNDTQYASYADSRDNLKALILEWWQGKTPRHHHTYRECREKRPSVSQAYSSMDEDSTARLVR